MVRHDYLPFGEELTAGIRGSGYGYASTNVRQKFTGHERDGETGLDFAEARYCSSVQGRFNSPDDFLNDSQIGDPQSWNKYVYARNNPQKLVDPTGEKATVTIQTNEEEKTGTIKITASIAIWTNDKSISTRDLTKAAADIKKSIEKAWKGSFQKDGISYTVETNVDIQVKGSEKDANGAGSQNVIEIKNGPYSADSDSVVPQHPLLGGSDSGTWNIQNLNKTAGHEFAHLLGVKDRNNGNVLSNTNLLNDTSIPLFATASDFGWALGGAIDSHRNGSRPWMKDPTAELGKGPQFVRGSPQSSTTTLQLRAPRSWWLGN